MAMIRKTVGEMQVEKLIDVTWQGIKSTTSTNVNFTASDTIPAPTRNPGRVAFKKLHRYTPGSPYSLDVVSTGIAGGSSYEKYNTNPQSKTMSGFIPFCTHHSENIAPVSTYTSAAVADVDAQALGSFYSKIRSQSFSVVETLVEGRKTVDMILDAVRTVAKAVGQVKKGRFQSAATTLGIKTPKGAKHGRTWYQNWLEYRYGWLPLYYTVYGVMEETYKRTVQWNQSGILIHTSSYSNNVKLGLHPVTRTKYGHGYAGVLGLAGYTSNSATVSRWSVSSSENLQYSVCYWGYVKITNPTLASSSRMGLTNPLLVAWELVPLSFVADWFVNVSDVLQTLDAFSGRELVNYGRSTLYKVKRTATSAQIAYVPAGWSCTHTSNAKSWQETVTFRRVVLSTPPSIPLTFNVELNQKRLIDAIALLKTFTK